jgi:phospholipid/cholesterol/gamma-HCH transport system ATP-binding protein
MLSRPKLFKHGPASRKLISRECLTLPPIPNLCSRWKAELDALAGGDDAQIASLSRRATRPGVASSEPLIVFSDVFISFNGRAVLEDVSFSVDRGETLCILGRSGVGKSVCLRLLMGFLKPDSGSIRVEGQEITSLGEEGLRAIRKRVTMVFQNGALFDSLSVRENVAFPLRERGGLAEDQLEQIVDRLIGLVGAEDVADALPSSLSTGAQARGGHGARAGRAT